MHSTELLTLQQIAKELGDIKQELRRVIEASETRILLKIEESKSRIITLEKENSCLRDRLEFLDRKTRKNNIIVFGLNAFPLSSQSIVEKLNGLLDSQIREEDLSDAYRLGRSNTGPIKIELHNYQVKKRILEYKSKLKGTNIYINHDLTHVQLEEGRKLREYLRESQASSQGTSYIRGNRLWRNGRYYTIQELEKEENRIETGALLRENNSAPATPTQVERLPDTKTRSEIEEVDPTEDVPEATQTEEPKANETPELQTRKTATPTSSEARITRPKNDRYISNPLIKEKLRIRQPK